MVNQDYWKKKHTLYRNQAWSEKPSIFAEQMTQLIPKNARILELGAGQGQDSVYFTRLGNYVVSTDISDKANSIRQKRKDTEEMSSMEISKLDISDPFPYEQESFDIVYAHLAIQFFTLTKTQEVFNEVYRVLKPGGKLMLLVNSVNDPEYGAGEFVEQDYYFLQGIYKRFYSVASLSEFTKNFTTILLDHEGRTYKDTHPLVRFVGEK